MEALMENIPVSVWNEIPIIIIFASLLTGMLFLIVRIFINAIADVNKHYASIMESSNIQWQKYIDARSESSNMVTADVVQKMEKFTAIIQRLVDDQEKHDMVMRVALDEMSDKRKATALVDSAATK